MKRSEILIRISNWLLDTCPERYDGYTSYFRKLEAEDLLNILEKEGMMPPWSGTDKICMCSTRGSCPGCCPALFKSEWEKE